jgi:plastocyanin
MRATTKLLPLLGLAAVLLPVTPASAAVTDAAIANFSFSPDPVTIAVGDSVKWTNTDNAGHTVTADNGSFGSATLSPQGTFTQRFNQPGTIAYHCELHESMRGTVQVQGATTTTAAPTTTTTAAPTTATAAPTTTNDDDGGRGRGRGRGRGSDEDSSGSGSSGSTGSGSGSSGSGGSGSGSSGDSGRDD